MRIDCTRADLCLNGRFVLVADRAGREDEQKVDGLELLQLH
jgi:hypothetical protein